eukprot:1181213-Prorocentrum_minimum.AAC.7
MAKMGNELFVPSTKRRRCPHARSRTGPSAREPQTACERVIRVSEWVTFASFFTCSSPNGLKSGRKPGRNRQTLQGSCFKQLNLIVVA